MKKIITILCLFTLVFSTLLYTSANSETKSYNGYTAEDLKSNSESLYTSLSSFTEEEIEQYIKSADTITSQAVQSWADVKDEIGEFVAFGDFAVEESENVITTKLLIDYTQKDITLTVVFDENLTVLSILMEKENSLIEKMSKAGLNTLMGMGTVFAILIFITFLISLFKYIRIWEERGKSKNENLKIEVEKTQPAVKEEVLNEEVDDLELVAVIAAAIASATNTSVDGFVVRSIKRRDKK
ncbi:OadG family protein [Candidatus Galacturonibacter soehngenii]|nr:OadG family protein [Candidatus Galacturonibacter soehngenii]MBA4687285.1 OadG family protein [Candidatus Galacturonibacter soehngenii]